MPASYSYRLGPDKKDDKTNHESTQENELDSYLLIL